MTTNNIPVKNTDRELWRESDDRSQCTPSIHVTQDGSIGINVGGTVVVRTLREWHAMANAPRCSDAPSREWISKMADGEDKCPSVSARNPDAVEANPEASGVERFVSSRRGRIIPSTGKYEFSEVMCVTAADHDQVVAERDATIAELQKQCEANEDTISELHERLTISQATINFLRLPSAEWVESEDTKLQRQRAEAAEAKCAELEKHEAQTHERLGAILGTDDSLEECAKRLTAQLAAANERR